jgi:FkbM family methyltransferase
MDQPVGRKERRRKAMSGVYVSPVAQVVRCQAYDVPLFFTIANPRDEIQRHHLAGTFYETEELAIIARHFPFGGRYCDIGANVGNHVIFAAKLLHARLVVPFEPNPTAIALLTSNIHLNRIEGVCDLRFLGLGLSDVAVEGAAIRVPRRNLGAARLVEGQGEIRVETFDTLLPEASFDLVKIDVEGMELKVLAGMKGFISRCRPKIFIEVDAANQAGFEDWRGRSGYRVLETFQRYERNTNYLVAAE